MKPRKRALVFKPKQVKCLVMLMNKRTQFKLLIIYSGRKYEKKHLIYIQIQHAAEVWVEMLACWCWWGARAQIRMRARSFGTEPLAASQRENRKDRTADRDDALINASVLIKHVHALRKGSCDARAFAPVFNYIAIRETYIIAKLVVWTTNRVFSCLLSHCVHTLSIWDKNHWRCDSSIARKCQCNDLNLRFWAFRRPKIFAFTLPQYNNPVALKKIIMKTFYLLLEIKRCYQIY